MATLLRSVVLASLALAGCPEGREAPPASHRESPEPTAVQQAPPTDSPGAPEETDVPASPAPAEPAVVVDDGKSAAAMREALAVVRAQTLSPLHAGEALEAFFERRQYRPVFVVGGKLSTEAAEVVTALRGLSEHGVVVADYDLDALAASLAPGDVDPNRVCASFLSSASAIWLALTDEHSGCGCAAPERLQEALPWRPRAQLLASTRTGRINLGGRGARDRDEELHWESPRGTGASAKRHECRDLSQSDRVHFAGPRLPHRDGHR